MAKLNMIHDLLVSHDLITKERLASSLGITPDAARNKLAKWQEEGLVERLSAGCYISKKTKDSCIEAVQDAISLHPAVKSMVLVGASCWQKAGWCKTDLVHAAMPLPQSRSTPEIVGARLYGIGTREFSTIQKHSIQESTDKYPHLNPILMMLWYMEKDCPIMMPSPDKIDWEKLEVNRDLRIEMLATWPHLVGNFSIQGVYGMLYSDRWDKTTPGVTESPDPEPESDVDVPDSSETCESAPST